MDATTRATFNEFARNWPVVLGAAIGMGSGTVMLGFVFSFFLAPLSAEFGWSRTAISGALFLIPATALLMPLVGSLIDRFGGLKVAAPSACGLALGYILVTLSTPAIWTFYAALACALVLGLATGPIAYSRAVVSSFDGGRGFALALALSGSSLSAIILPSFVEMAVSDGGWRAGFVLLAGLAILVGVPAAWIGLRREAGSPVATNKRRKSQLGAYFRSAKIYILMAAIFCLGLPVFGLVSQLRPMLDDYGLAPSEAVAAISSVGLGILFGRILTGLLIDRIWAPLIAASIACFAMLGVVVLLGSGSTVWMISFGIFLVCIAQGGELDLVAFLTARYFASEDFGRLYGFVYLAFAVSLPLGGLMYAGAFDRFGSYDAALIGSILFFCASCGLFLALGRYPRSELHPRKTQIAAEASSDPGL